MNGNAMHMFLTGEIQVGKSTLIRRVLAALPDVRAVGFRTVTAADLPDAVGSVYLVGLDHDGQRFDPSSRVGIRRGSGQGIEGFPYVFDEKGTALLQDAEKGQLIIMDEIGRMEAEAAAFRARVEALLDGDVPILGVVQKRGDTPLQRHIRTHPGVRLVTVTPENRDELLPQLTETIRMAVNRRVDSAGAFVFRERGGIEEVLMIRGRRGWGFPKGHIEAGETAETAACREALEETGVSIRLLPDFRFATVSGLEHEDRKLYYFLAAPAGGTLRPQPGEVREAEWIPAAEAEARIRFAEDVPAFRAAWERYRILGGDPAPDSPAS